jgi:hypothetical protein
MTDMIQRTLLGAALTGALLFAIATLGPAIAVAQQDMSPGDYASAEDPPAFDDPAQVVEEFKAKLAANDFDGVARLLGLDAAKVRTSERAMETYEKIREGSAKRLVIEEVGERRVLNIGDDLWPLPFPIVRGADGKWAFDTYAGIEEVINRRIGENELEAIATARAYVEAQQDYASADRDGDGVLEYAQKLISSEGQTDGLYWPATMGQGDSPAGSFVDQAALEKARAGDGYFGYRFRILTGQGDNIAGGKHDYIINGNMIAGFALIAWPVKYSETGVRTFAVSQHGIVYEADLGEDTESVVQGIKSFDPDESWEVVSD